MPTFREDLHLGHKVPLIETDDMRDGLVTTDKLSDNAVTEGKLADGAVTNEKLGEGAVVAGNIAESAVENKNLAEGAVIAGNIADNAVTEGKLADGAVTQGKIAVGAVIAGNIAENAVTEEKISDNAVTERNINDEAVTTQKIANGAVTEEKLADGSATTAKLADGSVGAGKIANGAVTTQKIAEGAVVEGNLAAGAVTSDKLAPEVITQLETITDAEPTPGSVKPVQSGGVDKRIADITLLLQNGNTEIYPIETGVALFGTTGLPERNPYTTNFGVTDFIPVGSMDKISIVSGVMQAGSTNYSYLIFYNANKEKISTKYDASALNSEITNKDVAVDGGAVYFRLTTRNNAPAVINYKGDIPSEISAIQSDLRSVKTRVQTNETNIQGLTTSIENTNNTISNNKTEAIVSDGDAASLFEVGTLDTNQGVGNVASLYKRTNENMRYLQINVIVGDKYLLTASGSPYGYSYAILDENRVILEANRNSSNRTITIPSQAASMVVQYNVTLAFEFFKLTSINEKVVANATDIENIKNGSTALPYAKPKRINLFNSDSIIANKTINNIAVGSEQTLGDSSTGDSFIYTSTITGKLTVTGLLSYSVTNSNDIVSQQRAAVNAADIRTITISAGYKLWVSVRHADIGKAMIVVGEELPTDYSPYSEVVLNYENEKVYPLINIKPQSITEEMYANKSLPSSAMKDETIQDLKWDNILWGKKLVVCGDSFTYGTGSGRIPASGIYGGKGAQQIANWARFIALRNNMNLYNEAIGGSTMAMPTAWIEDETKVLTENELLHIFSYKRYLNSNFDDADYIIIHLGINDAAKNGKLDDTDATFLSDAYSGSDGVDITQVTHADFSFYGAYNKVVRSILTRNPRAKIGIVIAERGSSRIQQNIINVAIRWGIPYIFQSGDPHVSLIGVGTTIQYWYHGRMNSSYWYEVKRVNKEEYSNSSLSAWDSETTYSNGDNVKYNYFDVATGKNEYIILQSLIDNNNKKPIVTMSDEAYEIRNRAFDSKYGSGAPDAEPGTGGSPYHPNYWGQLYLSTVYENFLRSL